MDAAPLQTGEMTLPMPAAEAPATVQTAGLSPGVLDELWSLGDCASAGLTRDEFASALNVVGARFNYGLPAGAALKPADRAAYFRALRLPELALAQGCALGREAAWTRFFVAYRAALTQAAIGITGSATLGHDLADALYAELYGLRERAGTRVSPLLSYSGRGSLLGWLRTTLAQRHVDHHRRTRRESPLEELEVAATPATAVPATPELQRLGHALRRTLQALPAEDRFILSAYFLDRRTLLELARVLRVHEATVSRRLKRLTGDMRKQLLQQLQLQGLSRRAAEEALGIDPRDVEINLRQILQTSQTATFNDRTPDPVGHTQRSA